MTEDLPLIFHKTILQKEYRTLSRVREEFPRRSNHKAVIYIEKELTRLVKEIDKINQQLKYEVDK